MVVFFPSSFRPLDFCSDVCSFPHSSPCYIYRHSPSNLVSIDLEFLSALSNLSFYIFGAHVLPHLLPSFVQFVFYSILVAQASQRGATTAITSFVAILTGLCATLFLVTVYRKALPALPISIVLGLLFYVLTRYTIDPFVNNLLPELLFH
jgi:Presenilin